MDDCAFLHIGGGICPHHARKCDKPCDKYSPLGDSSKDIFHDWNEGIKELADRLKLKYFGTTEDINEFLGD